MQYPNREQKTQLSGLWVEVATALSMGDKRQAIRHVLQSEEAREEFKQTLVQSVTKEVNSLCDHNDPSLFRGSTLPDLKKFSYDKQNQELQVKSPIFSAVLHAAAESSDLRRNKQKTPAMLIPGITTAAGILLNCRSKYMNAHQVLTSLTLKQSSAKRNAFNHLHSRFVCSSYKTVMQRQIDFGTDFDKDVIKWAEGKQVAECTESLEEHGEQSHRTDNGYQLIMDNVDIIIHPRHTSREKHGTDLHMVQVIAVENRVNGHHLPNDGPVATLSSVDIADFLPTLRDNQFLKKDWIVLIGNIISEHIPSLKWFSEHIPAQIQHAHLTELQKKSKIVSSICVCAFGHINKQFYAAIQKTVVSKHLKWFKKLHEGFNAANLNNLNIFKNHFKNMIL